MSGRDLLAQAADGADRNDLADPEFLERKNIRAKIDFRRQPTMSLAMARQKNYLNTAKPAANQSIRRFSEGRLDLDFTQSFDFAHLVKTAAADHANDRCSHDRIKRLLRQDVFRAARDPAPRPEAAHRQLECHRHPAVAR